jgi:hypothetical protein
MEAEARTRRQDGVRHNANPTIPDAAGFHRRGIGAGFCAGATRMRQNAMTLEQKIQELTDEVSALDRQIEELKTTVQTQRWQILLIFIAVALVLVYVLVLPA